MDRICRRQTRPAPHGARCVQRLVICALGLSVIVGCRPANQTEKKPEPAVASAPPALRLLVVDDPPLAEAIRRQWSERGEGELLVSESAAADLRDQEAKLPDVDAAIYPAELLGDFAGRQWLRAIPERTLQDAALEWRDVFELTRQREVVWNRQVLALPLGAAAPLLWYRADLWEQAGLTPPRTWEEYAQALASLRASDPQFKYASAEPLGAGWAGSSLLVRAASYARHRSSLAALFDARDMRPLIAGPPFVRALEELVAATGTADALQWTPPDAVQQVLSGEAAAAVGWVTEASWPKGVPGPAKLPRIAVTELPGAAQAYDRDRNAWEDRDAQDRHVTPLLVEGRLASVTRKVRSERTAANLLVWLTGPEWGAQIAAASRATMPSRQRQLESLDRWFPASRLPDALVAQIGPVVKQSFERRGSLTILAVPGRREYLGALDAAVARAVRGEQSAAESLTQAAAQWQEITDRLGREAQVQAYQRSLGL